MQIELITIGDELLSGITLNTNAQFVGDQLSRSGLAISRQVSIPDEHRVIVSALRESLARADWVLVTGGLGPTNDDVTKSAIAEVFDTSLTFHAGILAELRERYARAGRTVTAFLDSQAMLPVGSEIIPNPVGTAPGFYLKRGQSTLVAMPGVPREMRPMIVDHVVPLIASKSSEGIKTMIWSSTGVPESRLYEILTPAMQTHSGVAVAFLPSDHGVRLRFSASGPQAGLTLDHWTKAVRPILAPSVYAEEDISLESVLGRMLKERELTITVVESCTGGLVAKRLTDVPGSSSYMYAGLVTYSNFAKSLLLDVDPKLIQTHGAVSEEVVRVMAECAIDLTGVACSIAVTGIAGPGGGTAEKPVGTVWVAAGFRGYDPECRRLQLMGDRQMIRERAAQAAMDLMRLRLLRYGRETF